jgi:hypothetical protein
MPVIPGVPIHPISQLQRRRRHRVAAASALGIPPLRALRIHTVRHDLSYFFASSLTSRRARIASRIASLRASNRSLTTSLMASVTNNAVAPAVHTVLQLIDGIQALPGDGIKVEAK